MTREQWDAIYRSAWDVFYTREHMQTILRRGVATNSGPHRLTSALFFFSTGVAIEQVHPLQAGLFRLKHRLDRRPTLPIEPVWTFYPKYSRGRSSSSTRAI